MREGQSVWGNTMGGIQPNLGLQNSPQATVWFQSPEISSGSAWPVPGPGVNLLLSSCVGERDEIGCPAHCRVGHVVLCRRWTRDPAQPSISGFQSQKGPLLPAEAFRLRLCT